MQECDRLSHQTGVFLMRTAFLDKLVERLDKLDSKSLQTQFLHLAREKGLMEAVFQSIQEGIIVVDSSCRIAYVNRATEQLLGLPVQRMEGQPIADYLGDIDWQEILGQEEREWARLMSREIEINYPVHRFVNFYVMPLTLSKPESRGAVIILRDITRDREHEATQMESERVNAVKLLAAGVAHEIGNPLNALNIHLQLLSRSLNDLPKGKRKDIKDLVDVARSEASRLDNIITQFLRAIRPSKPHFTLSRMDNLLKETLAILRHETNNRKITVNIKYAEELPRIPVDRDQIKQAFFNVIRNALQAMEDGGTIDISASCTDRHLVMSFKDTGTGIKPEDFGHLFEPYHTTKAQGTGLGLMIVQRILQDHGGRIEIVSKPGSGTRVTLLLPLAEQRTRLLPASTGTSR